MHIKQLNIINIRNLKPIQLHLSKGFNAFYGINGSGKTSLLEAIYVLGMGKSFRATNLQQLINFEQPNYIISGVVVDEFTDADRTCFRIGMEKTRDNTKALFIKNGEKCSVVAVAKLLPLLFIDSSSLELIVGGPGSRRAFIDFGLFHVEHYFFDVCHKFKRCLAQRNATLKSNAISSQKRQQLEAWNEAFLATAETVTSARKEFVIDFAEVFNKIITGWKYCGHVSFKYKQGWDEDLTLQQALAECITLDFVSGCTNRGPHRAELDIFVDGIPVKNILSRGQQKVFVCAMILAKAVFLQERAKISSIFLIDDLASELDQASFQLVIGKLKEIGGQVFITGIEKEPLLAIAGPGIGDIELSEPEFKLFHVEQLGELAGLSPWAK